MKEVIINIATLSVVNSTKLNNKKINIIIIKFNFNLYLSLINKIEIKRIGLSLDKKLPSFFSSPNTSLFANARIR